MARDSVERGDEVRTRERTAALILSRVEAGSVMAEAVVVVEAAGVPQHCSHPRDTFNYSSRFLLRS